MGKKDTTFFGRAFSVFGRAFSLEPMFNTGGSNGGSQMTYRPYNGGPNGNVIGGFARMRSYSHDITRKIPELDNALDTRGANIIGTGIRGIPMTPDENLRKLIKGLWEEWSDHMDYDDDNDAAIFDKLVVRSSDEGGECFIRKIYLPASYGLKVPIQFQIIESECLDHTYNQKFADGSTIIAGVEFNAAKKRVAYYFFKNNPTDAVFHSDTSTRIRVPADEICHYYYRKRPSQVRGTPRAATAHMQMRDLMIYEENELERKKNSSATFATITSQDSRIMSELGPNINTFEPDPDDESAARPMATDPAVVEKGTVIHLYPGEKLEETKAADTDPGYDAYVAAKNRSHAAALGLAYETYSGDLRGNSYSGIRVAKNLEETKFRSEQEFYIKKVKQWIWNAWFDCAVMCGAIKVNNYVENRSVYTAINWQAPGWKYINPLQEINATKAEIDAGILTKTMAAAHRGRDYEEIAIQKKSEREIDAKYGNDAPA